MSSSFLVCYRIKKGALDTKGGMFFVELKSTQPDGSDWNTEAQDKLASKWSAVSIQFAATT
jgi:hypothetical protein